MVEPLAIPELIDQLHGFAQVFAIKRSTIWSGGEHGA